MDALPFVTPVYKRDLTVEHYAIGYLQHPYVSLYTGRGCRSQVHLLPLAADGGRAALPHAQRRARGRGDGAGRAALPAGEGVLLRRRHVHRRPAARRGHRPAARAGSASPGRSTPRPTCPYATLKVLKDNGLRLLLVGYESGNQADPEQRQEGRPPRRRAPVHARRQGARHHHPRHLHPGAARRDARDDRGDHPLRRARSIPTPSRSRWPRRIRAPRSTRRRSATAGSRPTTLVDGAGRAGERPRLPAPPAHRDLPLGRRVLPPLLLPPAQDDLARRRDAARPPGHAAPPLARAATSSAFLRKHRSAPGTRATA